MQQVIDRVRRPRRGTSVCIEAGPAGRCGSCRASATNRDRAWSCHHAGAPDRLEIAATCAGAPLAGPIVMHRHLASRLPLVALLALAVLAPGCKSMGGVMSGLGKVAAGAARGVAHAAPAVAR